MRKTMLTVAGLCLLMGGLVAGGVESRAQPVQVEADAILGSKLSKLHNRQEVLDALASMIRLYGWRCDSISAARFLVFSRGYKIVCNRYAYEYLIKDRGGRWVVTLE